MENSNDKTEPELLEFLKQLQENIQLMLGKDAMIAIMADPDNGIYSVAISLNQMPPSIVLGKCAALTMNKLDNLLGTEYNESLVRAMPTPSQKM